MKQSTLGHEYYTYAASREVRWKRKRMVPKTTVQDQPAQEESFQQLLDQHYSTQQEVPEQLGDLPLKDWERMQTEEGHTYYYHYQHGSVWKLPSGAVLLEKNSDLPSGWIKTQDMYFNQFTGEWRQTLPDGDSDPYHVQSSSDDENSRNDQYQNHTNHKNHKNKKKTKNKNKNKNKKSRPIQSIHHLESNGRTSSSGEGSSSEDEYDDDTHPIEIIRDTLWVAQRRASEAIMSTAVPALTDFGQNVVDAGEVIIGTLRRVITNTFFPDEQEVVATFQGARTTFAPLSRPLRRSNNPLGGGELHEVDLNEQVVNQEQTALRGLELCQEGLDNHHTV